MKEDVRGVTSSAPSKATEHPKAYQGVVCSHGEIVTDSFHPNRGRLGAKPLKGYCWGMLLDYPWAVLSLMERSRW